MKKLATFLLLVLLCGSAYARDGNLVVLFASEPGTQAAGLQSAQGGMSGFSPSLFDFNGDERLEWTYSVQVPEEFPVLLRAVTDLTDDGFPDLVIFLPEPRQVQVWGIPQ